MNTEAMSLSAGSDILLRNFFGYRSSYSGVLVTDAGDCTTALQNLIDEYEGSVVVLPPGTIRFSSLITVKPNTKVVGAPGYRTILNYAPTGENQKAIELKAGAGLEDLFIKQTGLQTSTLTTGIMVYANAVSGITMNRVKLWGPTIQLDPNEAHGKHLTSGADSNPTKPVACLLTQNVSRATITDVELRGANNTYGWDCATLTDSRIRGLRAYDNGWDGLKIYYATERCRFTDIECDYNGQSTTNGGGIDGSPINCTFENVHVHYNEGVGFQLKTGSSNDTNAECHGNTINNILCNNNHSSGIGLVHTQNASAGFFGMNSFNNVTCIANGVQLSGSAITISPGTDNWIYGCRFSNVFARSNAGGFNISNGRARNITAENMELYGNNAGAIGIWNMVIRGQGHRFNNIVALGVDPVLDGTYGANDEAGVAAMTPISSGLFIQSNATANLALSDVVISNIRVMYSLNSDHFVFNDGTTSVSLATLNGAGANERLRFVNEFPRQHGLYFGSGTPENVVTAPVGSFYQRSDGGASTTLYVKTSGTGAAGWTAK